MWRPPQPPLLEHNTGARAIFFLLFAHITNPYNADVIKEWHHIVRCQYPSRKLTGVILLLQPFSCLPSPSFKSSFDVFGDKILSKCKSDLLFYDSAISNPPRIWCENLWGKFGGKDFASHCKELGVKGGQPQSLVKSQVQDTAKRLRECCRHSQAEVISKSRNKIHQTWSPTFCQGL